MSKARYNSYIICTTPRSGSTLLCALLAAIGMSEYPDHFFRTSISDWLDDFGLSETSFVSDRDTLKAVFAAAQKRGTGDTGVFGLRLQRGSFDFFIHQTGILYSGRKNDLERIRAAFGRTLFIYLTRHNKLEQAISRVKAEQTGLWHKSADGTELERISAPQEPYYDAGEIAHHITELSALDEAWKVWFDQEKVQPLQISYDDLSREPSRVLAEILGELGLDRDMAHGVSPPVAKLADMTNRNWAERYLAENPN